MKEITLGVQERYETIMGGFDRLEKRIEDLRRLAAGEDTVAGELKTVRAAEMEKLEDRVGVKGQPGAVGPWYVGIVRRNEILIDENERLLRRNAEVEAFLQRVVAKAQELVDLQLA